jgi:phosphoribosylaminoimidazole carboxylase PurE protein
MMKKKPVVAIVMGSDSDLAVMAETAKALDEFGVEHELLIVSAHRTPDRCRAFARGAAGRGIKVIVAGAGKAAHLAGVIAAHTTVPVIGVPLDAGMNGLDALLSTVQMPGGVPVACMAVGKAGAKNAGLLAVEILALDDAGLTKRLTAYRSRMAREVAAKARAAARSGGPAKS